MAAAVRPATPGRPSVEAPLHGSFGARFVIHTHPALVNGLTCSRDGEEVCRRLFPDVLRMPYVEPGYTLCMEVRTATARHRAATGTDPAVVMLQNHGLFVAGDTPDAVRSAYWRIMAGLRAEYVRRGVSPDPSLPAEADPAVAARLADELRAVMGAEAAHAAIAGPFDVAEGPLSPDHIVYARSFPLIGPAGNKELEGYRRRHGVWPKVVATPEAVAGVGASRRDAELALEFAQNGSQVRRLAMAFGGPRYLSDAARRFIEKWEAESYRRQVSTS